MKMKRELFVWRNLAYHRLFCLLLCCLLCHDLVFSRKLYYTGDYTDHLYLSKISTVISFCEKLVVELT